MGVIVIVGLFINKIRPNIVFSLVFQLLATFTKLLFGGSITGKVFMYLFVLVAAFCLIIWGRFWYLEPKGKYGVGHREIILKGRDTNPVVSIYYPIDKKYYKKHRNDNSMTSEWTIEKEKTIEAFNHMTGVPK